MTIGTYDKVAQRFIPDFLELQAGLPRSNKCLVDRQWLLDDHSRCNSPAIQTGNVPALQEQRSEALGATRPCVAYIEWGGNVGDAGFL